MAENSTEEIELGYGNRFVDVAVAVGMFTGAMATGIGVQMGWGSSPLSGLALTTVGFFVLILSPAVPNWFGGE